MVARTRPLLFLVAIASVLSALPASAEKLEGVVWDTTPLVIEGVEVVLSPAARLERKGHPNLTAQELRIGWEVEVEGDRDGDRLVARRIKVKTERHKQVDVEGFVESLGEDTFEVEGHRVRWSGVDRTRIQPGISFDGKGALIDDGTIEIESYEIRPRDRDDGEVRYLAVAATELQALKKNLAFYDDRLFQEYVARVGHSLVPEWVNPEETHFNFSIVDDPELNAFALPDGTVVVHTGLLATLENEAQLAAVLGHEIAHVVHKHGYKGYRHAQKMQWIALGAAVAAAAIDSGSNQNQGQGPSWASTLVQLGATLTLTAAVNGHGRNMEDDADLIGLDYAIHAGYDPFQAPRVWEIFRQHTGDRNAVANWFFSDHSTHQARIGNLTQEINRYYRGTLDPEKLNRNEDEYTRMVARLRRHNAVMDYERKEYKNAESAFRRILAANGDDAEAHLYLGKILWDTRGMNGADDALAELKRVSELDPKLADPYRERGFIYYGLGYRDSSIEAFQKYLEMAPTATDAEEVRGYLREIAR
jgi:beta-barrel assembly-enhancing protease